MLSKNYFLDIMADVKSDYVEEVLYMSQPAQDNNELEKYRRKSRFWKVFGSVAACLAVIGVGFSAVMLYKSGLFNIPGESTATNVTEVSGSGVGEVTGSNSESITTAENNGNTADTTRPDPDPYEVQEIIISLGAAIDRANTYEEMFEEFNRIDTNKLIYKVEAYESSELREQGTPMKEEELTGEIPIGTIIVVYFSEDDTGAEMLKISTNKLPDGVVLHGLAGDEITSKDINKVSYNNPENPDAWGSVDCEGFCYLSEPIGYCFNSIDNPDLVDLSTGEINGGIMPAREIKRYYVGDEICGLKVKSADFSLWNMYGDNEHGTDGCRVRNDVIFEGPVDLTGYLWIDDNGTAFFVPDNVNGKELPVLSTPFERHYSFGSVGNDFGYSWENPVIECETVTGLNTDNMEKNKPIKIYVTLTDFSLGFSQGAPVDSFADGKITLKALP